ncbi:MAG: adenylate/guanylate cyclase domain-containing protein [Deltaproteobacteria bacterium]|nr:adenylate/guanylate cyclase domain-containing protein [Deltaproteobacteria bacterium]
MPVWLALAALIVFAANLLAGVTTWVTVEMMHGVSAFAEETRRFELSVLPYWRSAAYTGGVAVAIAYLRPIVAFFKCGAAGPASELVQRRVTNAPAVLAFVGFALWVVSILVFPALTVWRFGHWGPDLMSQQVLGPLVNGFLAATVSYLLVDWLFRSMVTPTVFPEGRVAEVSGSLAPGVRMRLLLFLIAVAFIPLFMLLGLVRAAVVRIETGRPAAEVVASLATASTATFGIFVALGIVLTLVVARSLTLPLGGMAAALKRIEDGDLDVAVAVSSADEVGVLADGVNAMVETLRDRERILQTFGRVVEPSVRDRLLAGDVGATGELRTATILFCDLRGFTAMAEHAAPAEVVASLNEFFTAMTTWVRACGGFVDKFIGDALLVVFGLFADDAPAGACDEAGAAAALRCAVGMHERLAELNAIRARRAQPPLAIAIGMHSGDVLAGTIGAADRHEYTVIGDAVNVAARLQQLCKDEGRALLVSETAYIRARAAGFPTTLAPHDLVVLRGRREPIAVVQR